MSYLVLNRHPRPEAGYLYDVVHACTGESKRDWSYSYACRVAEFENAFRESEPACDFDRCQRLRRISWASGVTMLFSGGKFGMEISADGDVQVKDGYGQGWIPFSAEDRLP